jgi:hypothetical protein
MSSAGGDQIVQEIQPATTNAWVGGPRRIRCLWCTASFLSGSKAERLCPRCRAVAGRSEYRDWGTPIRRRR